MQDLPLHFEKLKFIVDAGLAPAFRKTKNISQVLYTKCFSILTSSFVNGL